uniref:Transposable element P transposase-like GTP-binding insertion domain-containing protein n=1 Tax=Amphimedon queenslandica TaxID=400682 RepID=A0A1X7VL28_AMPQE
MQVDLASEVLSASVSKALELVVGEEAAETVKFADYFDKFFDALNVSNFDEGKRSTYPFQAPYRSKNDFRLKWLKEDFLGYIDK